MYVCMYVCMHVCMYQPASHCSPVARGNSASRCGSPPPLGQVRGWHGFAMTGASGKLIAAADIKRSDLVLTKLCCTCMACKSNAVASHHTHHQRDAKRAAVAREAAGC